jgi:3-hydroxyisobutyrate dehydrogenase
MEKEAIGFIGLGEMGLPMAINLQNGGYQVNAFDVDKSRCKEASDFNIICYANPKEVAKKIDKVIFCIVRNIEQTESVLFSDDGIIASGKKGLTIIIMSTLDPSSIKSIEEKIEDNGNYLIDAPVSGAKNGAEEATLTILSAGKEQLINDCKKYFNKIGDSIFYFGKDVGLGQAAKLANNLILSINMVSFIEGIRFAKKFGVSEEIFTKLINASSGCSWVSQNWEKQVKVWYEKYKPNQTLDIVYKDLIAIMKTCSEKHLSLPLSGLTFHTLLDAWKNIE